jgi:PIN domain nuclease of toxin-antitoxin system
LDSSVLFWLSSNGKFLGKQTLRLIQTKDIYFSAVSLAELQLKAKTGRIRFSRDPVEIWQDFGIRPLTFFLEAATHFASFSPHEIPDPFDRLIMASARANNLTLITSDQKILSQNFSWVLDSAT